MNKSFTLIEIMIVVVIIGILVGGVAFSYKSTLDQSRYVKALQDMKDIANSARLYFQANGNYPDDMHPTDSVADFDAYPTYLKSWPTPPCPNMVYDWENWNLIPPQTLDSDEILRVTLRKNNPPTYTVIFFYCLETQGVNCNGSWPGQDMRTVAPKTLQCN